MEGAPELWDLNLCSNKISEIDISSNSMLLSKLETLNLGNNDLKCLPEELDQLKALRKLDLRCNSLEAIPKRVCSMKIKDINISSHPIIMPPIEICEQGVHQMQLCYERVHKLKRLVGKHLLGLTTIGIGAFSTVFAGVNKASGKAVAIKVIDRSKMQWGDRDAASR